MRHVSELQGQLIYYDPDNYEATLRTIEKYSECILACMRPVVWYDM